MNPRVGAGKRRGTGYRVRMAHAKGIARMKKDNNEPFDAIEKLLATALFKELTRQECEQVSKLVKWRTYLKGAEVIYHMASDDDVYLVATGRVRVTIFSLGGKEISYQELGPGAIFGELSAIDGSPRTANVIALEESRIGLLGKADYWRLMEQYPAVAAGTLKRLAGLVRFLVDRVYQYGALDVSDRIRMEILRLAQEHPQSDNSASIPDFPTHREIANRVNTHREAVTRELNELNRLGIIEQRQRTLAVLDLARLSEMLSEYCE